METSDDVNVGTVTQEILEGTDADPGEYPWMVQISLERPDGTFTHACGGSLIAPNWVMTAAHCVYPNGNYTTPYSEDELQLTFGEHNLASVDGTEQVAGVGLPLHIEEIIPHEDYGQTDPPLYGGLNDIALIRLNQNVVLNDNVQMVALASGDDGPTDQTKFSGWGVALEPAVGFYDPDILQESMLPVVENSDCDAFFDAFGAGLYRDLTEADLCAGFGTGTPATCNRDSGGPLVLTRENGCEEQLGLVNWGYIGCGGYTSYARVSHHLPWIQSKVDNLGGAVVYEAEAMAATAGGTYEGGWNLHSNGYVSFFHDFGGDATTLVVTAAGQEGWGWPEMRVTVNGQQFLYQQVNDPNWHDYDVNVPAGFGNAEVRIHFMNDLYRPEFGVDRNLLLDKVSIPGETACTGNSGDIPGEFVVESTEPGRFCGRLVIENNTATDTSSWTATVDIGAGVIDYGWNPNDLSGTGELEIDSLFWNEIIQPGNSYESTGFCVLHAPGAFEHPDVTVDATF
jgi:secreted trypsin-like serine protease